MTTTSLVQPGLHREAFESFLSRRQEPAWLLEARRNAFLCFEEMAWPSRRDEEWIRTDIRLFKPDHFRFPGEVESGLGAVGEVPLRQLLAEEVPLGGAVRSLDSLPFAQNLDADLERQGVVCCSLESALVTQEQWIRPHLTGGSATPSIDRFAALHAAAWSGGAFVHIPRGVVVRKPLYVLNALSAGGADFGKLLVILDEGAEATVLSETGSLTADGEGLHVGAVKLLVGKGARLKFVSLQNWGSRTWHFAHQRALVDRDGDLQWTIGALGGRLAKVNQHVLLTAPGAHSQVNGVMFTEGTQHFSYHTLQHHQAPHGKSDFLYKAALQDKSRTVWRGMIKVDPGAQKTDGYQRNDNLLLSANARADSIPGLEIEADDVRCTHGSTSGRVDDELIFYAQSRGFTRQEAIRMIVTGFFQQVFDRIDIESVREALGRAIARRVREYE